MKVTPNVPTKIILSGWTFWHWLNERLILTHNYNIQMKHSHVTQNCRYMQRTWKDQVNRLTSWTTIDWLFFSFLFTMMLQRRSKLYSNTVGEGKGRKKNYFTFFFQLLSNLSSQNDLQLKIYKKTTISIKSRLRYLYLCIP